MMQLLFILTGFQGLKCTDDILKLVYFIRVHDMHAVVIVNYITPHKTSTQLCFILFVVVKFCFLTHAYMRQ